MTEPGRLEADLSNNVRLAVLATIAEQRVSADDLARELGLVPTAFRALLVREHWPLRTALMIADGLRLPVAIRTGPSALSV